MVANLFGDFIKGKDYTYLPLIVQKGVLLHRQIDDYIDHHPLVTQLRLNLYKSLPKIAGIAIDLYFDHLLAKNWSKFSSHQLNDFIDGFTIYALQYENLVFSGEDFVYPEHFQTLIKTMVEHNFLKRYKYLEGLTMASTGLSKRISFENNLNEATDVFVSNEKEITTVFYQFMEDAINHFK